MEKNFDIYNIQENCNVKSTLFFNDKSNSPNQIFIFCHGYYSGKESNSIKIVANKLLEYNIPSISFDFPGHSKSLQGTDKLTVNTCVSYVNSVVGFIKKNYKNNVKISFFAISFGAYILLNKLIGDKSDYENIILRSPAFNMKKIFKDCLLKEPFENFKINGKGKTGYNKDLEVPYSFYEDLINNDLYNTYNEKRNILILQGLQDDTALISDTYKFIKNRPNFTLIEFENLKHHMSPEEIEFVTNKMIKQLELKNRK